MFSKNLKVVTHSSSCDFKPFVGSIEASSSTSGPVFGRSLVSAGASSFAQRSQAGFGDLQWGQCSSAAGAPLCRRVTLPVDARDPGSSSSALWSKSTNVSGCPTVEHGFGSFSSSSLAVESTRRKSAGGDPSCGRKPGSSAPKGQSMRDPASSSTLPSKSSSGAGCPVLGHGLGSFVSSSFAVKSTSRRYAGSREPGTCSSALKGKGMTSSQSFVDLFVPCTSPSQRVHLVDSVVQLSPSQDTHGMHGDMNSCGSVHGGVMHDNSSGLHVNSCGALGHKNSCHVHAAEVRRGTKALSTSTRLGIRCPAVEELASPQQAPGSLHGEVWASILQNQGPKIFRDVEIIPGCAATVACPSCPDHSPEPPGPGRIIRNMFGWSLEEEAAGSGVWFFRSALQGKNLFSSLDVTGDWVKKGSYCTAWAVPCDSLCSCSYSNGQGPAFGPHTGRRCWPLLEGVWRAIAPPMKPWCAEGEVPTAANLNLYRGGNSCVGWHRDDELLFGEFGEAKLIVSVSLGGSAVFRWKRRSCPDDEGHLCCLGHGDILVMDGRCQDKFLHRTDPCR